MAKIFKSTLFINGMLFCILFAFVAARPAENGSDEGGPGKDSASSESGEAGASKKEQETGQETANDASETKSVEPELQPQGETAHEPAVLQSQTTGSDNAANSANPSGSHAEPVSSDQPKPVYKIGPFGAITIGESKSTSFSNQHSYSSSKSKAGEQKWTSFIPGPPPFNGTNPGFGQMAGHGPVAGAFMFPGMNWGMGGR